MAIRQSLVSFAAGFAVACLPVLACHAAGPPAPAAESPSKPRPRIALVLSGGGDDGAFSAGLLAGWSKAGDRPSFGVITGVSLGTCLRTSLSAIFVTTGSGASLQRFQRIWIRPRFSPAL